MRRGLILVLGMLVAGTASAETPKYKIHWMLGHQNLDFFEDAARSFKKTVEEGSNGDIQVSIEVQAADSSDILSAPGSGAIAEKVAKGEAEMGHSFVDVLGVRDPGMYVFEVPYLFRGYQHLEGVFEGPVGVKLLAGLKEHGITGLAFTYSGGANGIATKGLKIRRPEDLKGLRVGVFGDSVDEAWLAPLGAKAVPIGHHLDRILPMARSNQLDAVAITWRNFEREGLAESFSYFNMPGSTYLVSVTYINPKFLASLPQKYQDLIRKAAWESSRIERRRTIQLNEDAKRFLVEDRGIQPVYLSAKDQARMADATKGAVAEMERLAGKDLIDSIRSSPDAPEHFTLRPGLAQR